MRQEVLLTPDASAGSGDFSGLEPIRRHLWLHGRITAIEPICELIFLRVQEGAGEEVVHWRPDTSFLDNGNPGMPSILEPGQQVAILYRVDANQRKIAMEVNVEHSMPSGGAKPRGRQDPWLFPPSGREGRL